MTFKRGFDSTVNGAYVCTAKAPFTSHFGAMSFPGIPTDIYVVAQKQNVNGAYGECDWYN